MAGEGQDLGGSVGKNRSLYSTHGLSKTVVLRLSPGHAVVTGGARVLLEGVRVATSTLLCRLGNVGRSDVSFRSEPSA